jgi:hypothetical protein
MNPLEEYRNSLTDPAPKNRQAEAIPRPPKQFQFLCCA